MIIRELQLLVTENMLQLQVRALRSWHRKQNCHLGFVRNSLQAFGVLATYSSSTPAFQDGTQTDKNVY